MPDEQPIKVLVVDDSESMRISLHALLGVFADLRWIGESSDGHDILEQCERLQPHVVLIDVALPHIDVPHTIRVIRERFPLLQVIGITGFEDKRSIDKILEAGAVLCLPKNANVLLIANAVRQVVQLAGSL